MVAKQELVRKFNAAAAQTAEEAERTEEESTSRQQQADEQLEAATTAQNQAESKHREAAVLMSQAIEAQKEADSAHESAASKQQQAARTQVEATEALKATAAAQKRAVDARERAAAAQTDLDQLSASLRPLKRSLDNAETDTESSPDGSCSKRRRTSKPAQQVVLVNSNDLDRVLEMMRLGDPQNPSIYDFQGRVMFLSPGEKLDIHTHGVTWRNGTIQLESHQSVRIFGRDVVLESILVIGGEHGVWIPNGGSLTMTACQIHKARTGLHMDGSSSLVASDLKLMSCRTYAILMLGCSSASFTDCRVSAIGKCCINIREKSSMVGTRMQVLSGFCSFVFAAENQSRLSLTACTLIPMDRNLYAPREESEASEAPEASTVVGGKSVAANHSCVVLSSCEGLEFEAIDAATVKIEQ